MEGAAQSPLVAWQTFFFLVGSSGAALTGLQFVVIALIAESEDERRVTRSKPSPPPPSYISAPCCSFLQC